MIEQRQKKLAFFELTWLIFTGLVAFIFHVHITYGFICTYINEGTENETVYVLIATYHI